MKQTLFAILFFTTLLFWSCSKENPEQQGDVVLPGDEVQVVTDSVAIAFDASVTAVVATKAPVLTIDGIKAAGAGFGVSAVFEENSVWSELVSKKPDYFYNEQVLWNGEKWVYEPEQYWPKKKNDKLSLFAYAPYNSQYIKLCDTTLEGADASKIEFSLAPKSNETIDFIADCVIDKMGNREEPLVGFAMEHELTCLQMYAKVDKNLYSSEDEAYKTRVIVKSARFMGKRLYTKGVYSYNTANADGVGSWDFPNISSGSYDIQMQGESIAIETAVPYTAENVLVLTSRDQVKQMLVPSAENPEQNCIFLIPGGGIEGIEEGDISVMFEYDIITEDSKLAAGYSCSSATKVVNFPAQTLKQGYTYKFTFTFCLNEVKIGE